MFILDSLALWGVFCFAAILMTALVENEMSAPATILLIVVLGGLQFFTNIQPLSYAWNNPIQSAWMLAAYLVIGVGYVYFKWASLLRKTKRRVDEYRAAWKSTSLPDGVRSWPLKVGNYKSSIFGWMMVWPLSALWTLLNDPLRRIFEEIYDRIGGHLQKMANKAAGEVDTSK